MPSKKEIRGRPPDERHEVRKHAQQAVAAIAEAMVRGDLRETLEKIRYRHGGSLRALGRWEAGLLRFADIDGRIEIDNNAAERALRVVALGKKEFSFSQAPMAVEKVPPRFTACSVRPS